MSAQGKVMGIKETRRGGAQQKLWAFASLIVLVAGFSLASPNFFQVSNIIRRRSCRRRGGRFRRVVVLVPVGALRQHAHGGGGDTETDQGMANMNHDASFLRCRGWLGQPRPAA